MRFNPVFSRPTKLNFRNLVEHQRGRHDKTVLVCLSIGHPKRNFSCYLHKFTQCRYHAFSPNEARGGSEKSESMLLFHHMGKVWHLLVLRQCTYGIHRQTSSTVLTWIYRQMLDIQLVKLIRVLCRTQALHLWYNQSGAQPILATNCHTTLLVSLLLLGCRCSFQFCILICCY
jgi:hypothetical protein